MFGSLKWLLTAVFVTTCIVSANAQVPDGYPANYQEIINASKNESGVIIYGNVAASLMAPFVKLVAMRYPWIKLGTTDDSQLWQKYYAESAAGVRTADMMLASHPDQWVDFAVRKAVLEYASPESKNLPDWSRPIPGIYTASADPAIIGYNRVAFPDGPPMSMAAIAQALATRRDLGNRIGALDPEGNALGTAIWSVWSAAVPNGWELIERIGANFRPERSSGAIREKLLSGEYALAVFTSGGGIIRFEEPANKALIGWGLPTDRAPVVTRNVAITKAAKSPNSAKLVLDLMLSRDGQIALSNGGMMPYREDVGPKDVKYGTFSALSKELGEEKILFISPRPELFAGTDEALARWRAALKRN